MEFTYNRVETEYAFVRNRSSIIVPLVNEVRTELGDIFDIDVGLITEADYRDQVDTVFENGDLGLNIAALVHILRTIDVEDDYPGFIVDEILGRELAGMIAGTQPLRMLGEATFHYADIHIHGDASEPAGVDDLDAALAAGFQERLPGWPWTARASPFSIK